LTEKKPMRQVRVMRLSTDARNFRLGLGVSLCLRVFVVSAAEEKPTTKTQRHEDTPKMIQTILALRQFKNKENVYVYTIYW
jgi:hypothetical protein